MAEVQCRPRCLPGLPGHSRETCNRTQRQRANHRQSCPEFRCHSCITSCFSFYFGAATGTPSPIGWPLVLPSATVSPSLTPLRISTCVRFRLPTVTGVRRSVPFTTRYTYDLPRDTHTICRAPYAVPPWEHSAHSPRSQ